MATSRGDTNGGHDHHQRPERDAIRADDSLDLDSSAAMSLDESSIHMNATSAASMTPLSVDITGASFARASRDGGVGNDGGGKMDNAYEAVASPNFSPLASESAAMSISGMDTPMMLASKRESGRAAMNGGKEKSKSAHDCYDVASKDSIPANGDGESTLRKKSLDLSISRSNNYNDDEGKVLKKSSQEQAAVAISAAVGKDMSWNSKSWDLEEARMQLRRASRECSRRGLKLASRWASEQLMGLALPGINIQQRFHSKEKEKDPLVEESCHPNDAELYAMSLFDLGEYSRAAHVLSAPSSAAAASSLPYSLDGYLAHFDPPRNDLTPVGTYLRAFSLYLEGERRREEQVAELRDPLERTSLCNVNLPRLEAELLRARNLGNLDAFGLYVYGVVLKGLRGTKCSATPSPSMSGSQRREGTISDNRKENPKRDAAHTILVQSILLYPFNWSAWLDLGELCVDDPSIDQEVELLLSPISEHWMYHFFCVHIFVESKANENAISVIEKLANGNVSMAEENQEDDRGKINSMAVPGASLGFFVQSAYLQSQLAMAYYDVRDYDSAHEHFLALSEREPYRLDDMDAFSNVLYVKDQKVALSHLAHRSVTVDKYRPETCIIVGNYYSSKGRHEKAVQYFQRALKLDRTYLSAWTLLGHEYIEMKNTAAAIEAYRRAVDISDREYRAWYGLGQTYEIMNMLLHALFYFRKAAALHPHDARMWCAIGGCLLGLDRRADAEKSYERAVLLGDGEGIATRKLAELYREDGDEEKASKCYLRHLELRYQSQLTGSFAGAPADSSPAAFETVVTNVRIDEPEAEALLYLAYYYRDNLEYDQAILCATRLEDYPGPEKEQGKGLLRDIRSRMDQKAGERSHLQGRPASSNHPSTPGMGLRSQRGETSMDSNSAANAELSFEFSP